MSHVNLKYPLSAVPSIPLTFNGTTYTPLDTYSLTDMFGRIVVSQSQTLFDSKQINGNQPLFWDEKQTSGIGTSGSYNTFQASSTLYVGTGAGQRVRQTRRHLNYQPGKAQRIFLTGILGSPTIGITKRLGYFNEKNGIFFQSALGKISVVVRSNTTGTPQDNVVNQDNWNLYSGEMIDFDACQIFVIEFEWLGVGSVRVGVVINGAYHWLHQFNHANSIHTVYMSTPNLPCRYEITNDGTGQPDFITHICAAVSSEGGKQNNGIVLSQGRGANSLVTNNDASIYPLVSLRFASGLAGSQIDILHTNVCCTSTSPYRWILYSNPVFTGTALTYSGIPNSSLEQNSFNTNGTTILSGTIVAQGYAQSTNESAADMTLENTLSLGVGITGDSDIWCLAAQRLSNQAETFYGSIGWRETT